MLNYPSREVIMLFEKYIVIFSDKHIFSVLVINLEEASILHE